MGLFGKSNGSSEKVPTRASLRRVLIAVLRTDADLNAFCVDHFPEVAARFGDSMDRLVKFNLLLSEVATIDILARLNEAHPEAVARHEQLIVLGDGRDALPTSLLDARERRSRQRMIEKVRKFWIEGVLEKSLHGKELFELDMEYRADMVACPWDLVVGRPSTEQQPIPKGKRMIELFDENLGELLILGAPESGKTTMLLTLCRDLLQRATADETEPIPVVFHVSTWAYQRLPLDEWVLQELALRYDITKNTAKGWITQERLTILLDGVDEVPAARRATCIEVINAAKLHGPIINFAVCCRMDDYAILDVRLRVNAALLIKQLPIELIFRQATASFGKHSITSETSNQLDGFLNEIKTPLELRLFIDSILPRYKEDLPSAYQKQIAQRHLVDGYVCRMLTKRRANQGRNRLDALRQLSLFAKSMLQQSIHIFYLEDLQPSLLTRRISRFSYNFILTIAVLLLFGGMALICSKFTCLLTGEPKADCERITYQAPYMAVIGGIFYCLMCSLSFRDISPLEKFPPVWNYLRTKWKELGTFLLAMLGFMAIIVSKSYYDVSKANASLVANGIIANPEMAKTGVIVLIIFLALPMFAMVIASILLSAKKEASSHITSQQQSRRRPWFNYGTYASLRNALSIAALFNAAVVLMTFLAYRAMIIEKRAFGGFVILSSIISTTLFLGFGGLAFIQHFVLRIVASVGQGVPLNLVHTLEWCVDRVFLYRVGSGYIFIHRRLMEYFASLTDADIRRLTAETTPRK